MSATTKSKVCFFYQTPVSLSGRQKLKRFIKAIFLKEKKELLCLNYIFCTDQQLLAINRQYLKHDYYTDIITFELSEKGKPIEGEVYISIDRVRDNAVSFGQPIYKEIHRVIFHGALHLCGYNDKTRVQAAKMRAKENDSISLYFK